MDSIVIGFSRPKNKRFPVFSWLIRLADNTEYSHVYVGWYSSGIDRSIIYEAGGTMVHFVGAKRFQQEVEILHQFEISVADEQKRDIVQFAVDNAETPYGIVQVLGISVVILLKIFGIELKHNPLSRGTDEEVCSELGGMVLQRLGIQVNKDLDIILPKDIFDIVSKMPNVKKTI